MNSKPGLWKFFYWHVLLLGSLIFSHPLFKTIGGQPEFLLAHNLSGLKLVGWVMAIGFLPGLILVSLVFALTKTLPVYADRLRQAVLFILFVLFAFIHLSEPIGSNLALLIGLSTLLAFVVVVAYGRSLFLRTFMSVATFLVIITPVLFSFSSEIRQILLPEQINYDYLAGKKIDKQPVVILLFDELPLLSLLDGDGRVNAERFPNFASFANQSTWYKYATSVAEATLNAVPPILTGKSTEPSNKVLPLAANYPENIFTLLSASHDINAYETFTHICPEELCRSARPDWRLIAEDTLVVFAHATTPAQLKPELPQIDNKWVGYLRGNEEVSNLHTDREMHPHHRYKVRLEKIQQFMFELEAIQAASVNYLHILMPHSPWMYLPDGRIYSQNELRSFTGTLPPGSAGTKQVSQLYPQSHLADFAQQRHLLQVGYVDSLLGGVMSILHERELFNDALIIVMADHGASFRPGESLREANEASYQDIMAVPLFIKYPHQNEAVTSLRAARTYDVLPTILDALNSEFINPDFDGHSLLQEPQAEPTALALQRDTGQVLEFQFTGFVNAFERAIESRKTAFKDGGFEAIYSLNDFGILNKKVAELAIADPVDYTLQLDSPHSYRNIDLSLSTIATLIRANRSTQSDTFEPETVAVAVNGVVRGTSILQKIETLAFDYQVLVAPGSFQNGPNSIHFYQINKTPQGVSLFPILVESEATAELIIESSESMSLNYNSVMLPVSSTGTHGLVTIVADHKIGQIRLTGWSANSMNGHIADEVFIFFGDEFLASVRPHSRYPQAMETTGYANSEYSGFNLIIPMPVQKGSEAKLLSAIAVFNSTDGSVAGELRYINYAGPLVNTSITEFKRDVLKQITDKNTVEPGRVYDFSDDTEAQVFSGSGWSHASSSGARWNAADSATLMFNVTSNNQSLKLIVEASPFFVKGKHETQLVEAQFLSGEKQQIQMQLGETDGKFSIHLEPQEIGSKGDVMIKLNFLNSASPKSLDVNSDPRPLAIKVKTLQLLITAVESK